MENIYCKILPEEYIVALGNNISDCIRVALKREVIVTNLIVGFVPPGISHQYVYNAMNFLLLIYSCMRGKYLSMKLLAKKGT